MFEPLVDRDHRQYLLIRSKSSSKIRGRAEQPTGCARVEAGVLSGVLSGEERLRLAVTVGDAAAATG
jgi:hypothetical protein